MDRWTGGLCSFYSDNAHRKYLVSNVKAEDKAAGLFSAYFTFPDVEGLEASATATLAALRGVNWAA